VEDIAEGIADELRWVRQQVAATPSA
jgi:hypothetical protein